MLRNGQEKGRSGCPGAAFRGGRRSGYSLTTSAFSMMTGTTGTFS